MFDHAVERFDTCPDVVDPSSAIRGGLPYAVNPSSAIRGGFPYTVFYASAIRGRLSYAVDLASAIYGKPPYAVDLASAIRGSLVDSVGKPAANGGKPPITLQSCSGTATVLWPRSSALLGEIQSGKHG